MRHFLAIALLFISFAVSAQDIQFQLTGSRSRKWVGANIYAGKAQENTTTLTFFTNHKVVEGDKVYKSTKPPVKWMLVTGEYMKDNNIVLMIGKHQYTAEFSMTNNGKDFLTLTRIPEQENEPMVMKTYVAE